MCGIAGIISFNKNIKSEYIKKMTDLVTYRGPDDYGYLAYNTNTKNILTFKELQKENILDEFNLYLGHRRLSIIDLTDAGHQPMSYANGSYWIVYNGEIYNYLELKDELCSKGYRFNSKTDTEVILAAYQEWHIDCLHKFNGMWSFAILDLRKNMLFCARDRYGEKPFYYYVNKDYFVFSSEIKQLHILDFTPKQFNPGFLYDFFVLDCYHSIGEKTAFKEILELRGGNYLIINFNDLENLLVKNWYKFEFNYKILGLSDQEYADKYFQLFYDSCKLRLRSDVKVGTALSGGLDSSGVAVVVNKIFNDCQVNDMQYTFTVGSENEKYDETFYAKKVIEQIKPKSFFTIPKSEDLIKDVNKLVWHHEEPFLSTSMFAVWTLMKLIKENSVKVTLDGQGADELLGGYFPYENILSDDLLNLKIVSFLENLIGFNKLQNFNYKKMIIETLKNILKNVWLNDFSIKSYKRKDELNIDFYNYAKKFSQFNVLEKENSIVSSFDKYVYKSINSQPLPGILMTVDRLSMAFSIETRLPFLDYRLVEYTVSLPNEQKVRNGITKYVYRNALKNLLPNEIFNRHKKFGFITAEPLWFRNSLKDKMLQLLFERKFKEIFNYEFFEKKFNNFLMNNENFSNVFWRFLCASIWLETFFEDK